MSLQIIAIVLVIAYGAVDKGIAAPTKPPHYECNGPENVHRIVAQNEPERRYVKMLTKNQKETELFCLTRDTTIKNSIKDKVIKLHAAKEPSQYLGINREGELIFEDVSTKATTFREINGSLCATLNNKEGEDSINGTQITYVVSLTGKGFRIPKVCCKENKIPCCTSFYETMKEEKYQWLLEKKY